MGRSWPSKVTDNSCWTYLRQHLYTYFHVFLPTRQYFSKSEDFSEAVVNNNFLHLISIAHSQPTKHLEQADAPARWHCLVVLRMYQPHTMDSLLETAPQPPNGEDVISEAASLASLDPGAKRPKGKRKVVSAQQRAMALSNATSQATAVAKSILQTGGTAETALLTARAAAESVLLSSSNSILSKRQAKQQAQIVASMALLTAQTAHTETISHDSTSGSLNPPSVIQQASTSRREELSSVGFGESVTNTEVPKEKEKESKKCRTRLNPSNQVQFPPSLKAVGGTSNPFSSPRNPLSPQPPNSSSKEVNAPNKRKENVTKEMPDKDPVHIILPKTMPPLEHPNSYDSDDEHSRSLGKTDEEGRSITSLDYDYGFSDLDENPRNSLLSIGKILADGMFCGPSHCDFPTRGGEERDDLSADLQSQDSRRQSTDFSHKENKPNSPSSKKDEISKGSKRVTIKELPCSNSDSTDSKSKKSIRKKQIKESMEKVVLRALATGETSVTRIDSQPSGDESPNNRSQYTCSSKKSMNSKASRLVNWMKRLKTRK